jgi:hypothetical protein
MQHNYEDNDKQEKQIELHQHTLKDNAYEWFLDKAKAISLHEMQYYHYVMERTTPFMVTSVACIIVSLTLF